MKVYPRCRGFLVVLAVLLSGWFLTSVGEDKEKNEQPKFEWNDANRKKALEFFEASEEELPEGASTIKLVYDFETMNESLVADWAPDMGKTKNQIRWSRGAEGTYSTVEHGIIVSGKGVWLHSGQWKSVKVTVNLLSMAGSRPGDLMAATYTYAKGKKSIGNNMGTQLVKLKGNRLSARPHPKTSTPSLVAETKYEYGYEYKDGVLVGYKNGRKQGTSADASKLVKDKPATGNVGLIWRGSINSFVFKVTIEGELDPDWFQKQVK